MNEVLNLLDKEKIMYKLVMHEAAFTVADMKKLNLSNEGYGCKNLFLRNSNGKVHYLISCHEDKKINLDEVAKRLGSTRLGFASKERLEKYLKLKPGSVTPFGLLNDESKSVIFVFDKELKGKENVGFHPNTNKATIYLKFDDVEKIIREHGNNIIMIDM